MTKKALRWDFDSLSDDERDQLVDEILTDMPREVGVVTESEQAEVIKQRFEADRGPKPTDEEGLQLFEGGDPELILILLETTLILLESGRISKEVYQIYKDRKEVDESIEMVDQPRAFTSLNGGEESG